LIVASLKVVIFGFILLVEVLSSDWLAQADLFIYLQELLLWLVTGLLTYFHPS